MKATTILYGLGAAGAGVGGWVAFRQFVRVKTRAALVTEYGFNRVLSGVDTSELLTGMDFNLPTLDELVVSLVPIWDTIMPDEAFSDVLEKGRKSRYWPEKYKRPVDAEWERRIFLAMKKASESPDDASPIDMAATAIVSLVRGK